MVRPYSWSLPHERMVPLTDDESEEVLLLREIRDLLRPVADHYQATYDMRQTVRALVNSSAGRRKAWELAEGNLSQGDIHKESGMDQGNLSRFFKQLREIGAITGDPPKRALEV